MKRFLRALLILIVLVGGAGWFLTQPKTIDPAALSGLTPDIERGEVVFNASGCASCHAGEEATGDARLTLSGGQRFPSPFGTFVAPNISNDETHGIGGWTAEMLANAMLHGTSPEGQHYFPAFPYASYARMELSDVVSLRAYLASLPSDATPSKPHEVGFPFNIRASLGGWKLLFLRDDWVIADGLLSEREKRGRYLVEAMGHCGECHTPRNLLGGLQMSKWLGGAANPTGDGRIPNITPGGLDWSEADIAEYLKSGFTPDFDTAGGHMVAVIENTGRLQDADREAIATYLKVVPSVTELP